LTDPRRGGIGVVMASPSLRDSHLAALYERIPGTVAFIDESYRVRTFAGEQAFYLLRLQLRQLLGVPGRVVIDVVRGRAHIVHARTRTPR